MNKSKHDAPSKCQLTTDEMLKELIKFYGYEDAHNVLVELVISVLNGIRSSREGKLVGEP